jgi:hypothetical protein
MNITISMYDVINRPFNSIDRIYSTPEDTKSNSKLNGKSILNSLSVALKSRAVAITGIFIFNVNHAFMNLGKVVSRAFKTVVFILPYLVDLITKKNNIDPKYTLIAIAKLALKTLAYALLSVVGPLIGALTPKGANKLQEILELDMSKWDHQSRGILLSRTYETDALKIIEGEKQNTSESEKEALEYIQRAVAEKTEHKNTLINLSHYRLDRLSIDEVIQLMQNLDTRPKADIVLKSLDNRLTKITNLCASAQKDLIDTKSRRVSRVVKIAEGNLAKVIQVKAQFEEKIKQAKAILETKPEKKRRWW